MRRSVTDLPLVASWWEGGVCQPGISHNRLHVSEAFNGLAISREMNVRYWRNADFEWLRNVRQPDKRHMGISLENLTAKTGAATH